MTGVSKSAEEHLAIDLHTHSRFSDGEASVQQIEDWVQSAGCSVVITDHNEIRGSVQLTERQHVPTCCGIEVGTKEGQEFLVYFPRPELLEEYYRNAVEPYLYSRFMVRSAIPLEHALDCAKALNAFIVLAHPFAFGRKSIAGYVAEKATDRRRELGRLTLDGVAAIEVHNSGIPARPNRRATRFVEGLDENHGLVTTVGSDAHRLVDFGRVRNRLPVSRDATSEEIFSSLPGCRPCPETALDRSSMLGTLWMIGTRHTLFFVCGRNVYRRLYSDR